MKKLTIACADGAFQITHEYLTTLTDLYPHAFVIQEITQLAHWSHTTTPRWTLATIDKSLRRLLLKRWDENVTTHAFEVGDSAWRLHGFQSREDYLEARAAGAGPGQSEARWLAFKADHAHVHMGRDDTPAWRAIVEAKRTQLERWHQAVLGKDWRSKLARYETEAQA